MTDEEMIARLAEGAGGYYIRQAFTRCIRIAEARSESPIETLFGAAFIFMMDVAAIGRRDVALTFDLGSEPKGPISAVQQYAWRNYRIDFALFAGPLPLVFIECDGHEFHERTKEQAERDRSRDREVQLGGLMAFRFTGREIWRDPFACTESAWAGFMSNL